MAWSSYIGPTGEHGGGRRLEKEACGMAVGCGSVRMGASGGGLAWSDCSVEHLHCRARELAEEACSTRPITTVNGWAVMAIGKRQCGGRSSGAGRRAARNWPEEIGRSGG